MIFCTIDGSLNNEVRLINKAFANAAPMELLTSFLTSSIANRGKFIKEYASVGSELPFFWRQFTIHYSELLQKIYNKKLYNGQ